MCLAWSSSQCPSSGSANARMKLCRLKISRDESTASSCPHGWRGSWQGQPLRKRCCVKTLDTKMVVSRSATANCASSSPWPRFRTQAGKGPCSLRRRRCSTSSTPAEFWACLYNVFYLLRRSGNSCSSTTSLVLLSRRAGSMFSRKWPPGGSQKRRQSVVATPPTRIARPPALALWAAGPGRCTQPRCEEEGLPLLLRRTPRQCEEEGRGANPSSFRRTQRHCWCTHRGCEEEGGRAIPLPPKKPRLMKKKPLDLRGGEPVSPPQWDAQPSNAQPNTRREKKDASNHTELCDSQHHRHETKHILATNAQPIQKHRKRVASEVEWSQNDDEGTPNICFHRLIPGPRHVGEAVPATNFNSLPQLRIRKWHCLEELTRRGLTPLTTYSKSLDLAVRGRCYQYWRQSLWESHRLSLTSWGVTVVELTFAPRMIGRVETSEQHGEFLRPDGTHFAVRASKKMVTPTVMFRSRPTRGTLCWCWRNLTNRSRAENMDQSGSNETWAHLASVTTTRISRSRSARFCGHTAAGLLQRWGSCYSPNGNEKSWIVNRLQGAKAYWAYVPCTIPTSQMSIATTTPDIFVPKNPAKHPKPNIPTRA